MTSSLIAIIVAVVLFYRHILKTLRDTKLKELLEGNDTLNWLVLCFCIVFLLDIDKRTRYLDPDQFSELADNMEDSKDFVVDNSDIAEEDSLMYTDFVYSYISVFYEVRDENFRRLLVALFDNMSTDKMSRFPKFLKSIFIFLLNL